jgi:Leucine-rich repeat (LRR) protein
MSIDLGNNPVGTPPTTEQQNQIRSAINAAENTPKQDGFIYLTSVETAATIDPIVKHDGADGCTGICYSVNGGAAVYAAIAANTNLQITPPSAGGGSFNVEIWPATSATSGRVGNLTYLNCGTDKVTSLDVTNCPTLTVMECAANQLTSLDVSNNTALTTLYCYHNQLTSLDVSNNTALATLRFFGNAPLETLDVSNTQITHFSTNGYDLNASSGSCPNLTSIRAVDCVLSYSYVHSTFTETTDIRGSNLDAAALNQFYTDLGVDVGATGQLHVSGNPGTTGDDPTIATAKGYTVVGS